MIRLTARRLDDLHLHGQRLYLAVRTPADRADLVVDHDDPDAPVLRAARGPLDRS